MKTLPIYPNGIPPLPPDLAQPAEFNPKCQLCPLHDGAKTPCMAAAMDAGSEPGPVLLVVGDGPGRNEDLRGMPFAGPAGEFLRHQIRRVWKGPIVFDNAVRCAPGAREVGEKHLAACMGYTATVIQETKPERILALGNRAIAALTGESFPALSSRRGYAHMHDGTPVFLLIHPNDALRNRFVKGWLEDDLEWALSADPPKPPLNAVVNIVETTADAELAVEELRDGGWATFDCETFGAMHDMEFRVTTMALAGPDDVAWVWEEGFGGTHPKVIGPALELLVDPSFPKGGQNAKFDCGAVESGFGKRVRGVKFDTKLWRKLLQADAASKLLHQQTFVGMAGGKREMDEALEVVKKEIRKAARKPPEFAIDAGRRAADLAVAASRVRAGRDVEQFAYGLVDPTLRARYCGTDAISTSKLRMFHEPRLRKEPGLTMVWDEIVEPLSDAVVRMEANGVPVSVEAIRRLQRVLDDEERDLRTRLSQHDAAMGAPFNPNSPAQVSKLLFEILKAPIPRRAQTATGKISTSAEVLEELPHPVAKDIIQFRRVTKFRSNYADGMEVFIRDDGRIHPDVWIDGTETGRPSCKQPNVFNIPRAGDEDGDWGKMCRDIFCAEPGNVIFESDFSQIELREAANLSGDKLMIELFESGQDFHLATAKLIAPILGFDASTITKEHKLRSDAKTVNFATLYGDPPAGLAMKLRTNARKAQQLQDAILGRFVDLKKWIEEQLRFARLNGFCRTMWRGMPARIRPLWRVADANDDVRANAERSSWNTPVQGSAAERTNRSLSAIQQWIDQTGVPARLILTVYDSILLEVRKDAVPAVAERVPAIMKSWPSRVPIEVDSKVGPSWGSLKKLEA